MTTVAEGLQRLAEALAKMEIVTRHLAAATTHKRFQPREAKPVLEDLATSLRCVREALELMAR